ncbi:hypothetical protein T439DRAFT_327087 [Meredithblackwellia eburnea MCA 4105]
MRMNSAQIPKNASSASHSLHKMGGKYRTPKRSQLTLMVEYSFAITFVFVVAYLFVIPITSRRVVHVETKTRLLVPPGPGQVLGRLGGHSPKIFYDSTRFERRRMAPGQKPTVPTEKWFPVASQVLQPPKPAPLQPPLTSSESTSASQSDQPRPPSSQDDLPTSPADDETSVSQTDYWDPSHAKDIAGAQARWWNKRRLSGGLYYHQGDVKESDESGSVTESARLRRVSREVEKVRKEVRELALVRKLGREGERRNGFSLKFTG